MTDIQITFDELEDLIKPALKMNSPIALFSRPGTGKSSYLKDLTESGAIQGKVFTIAINQIADKADLTGVRIVEKQDDDGATYYQQEAFPHATLMEAIRYANSNPDDYAIVFLDEFNRTSQDVTSATLSLTTERKIGTIHFPDNVRFVLAGNKEGNVIPFDDATATRFLIFTIRPDHMTFLDVNPDLNAFIKEMIIDDKGYLLGEAEPMTAVQSNNQPNPYDPDDQTDDDLETDAFEVFDMGSGITEDRTVPRTLTMMSNWLNEVGIDKSGSNEEYQALGFYLQELQHKGDALQAPTILQAGIEATLGQTGTSRELMSRILGHYEDLTKQASTTVQSNNQTMTNKYKELLEDIRPNDSLITEINAIKERQELMDFVEQMDGDTLASTMLWLLTTDAYQSLTGDVTPTYVMENIAQQDIHLDKRNARFFHQLVGHQDGIVKRSLTILKENTPPSNTDIISLVTYAEAMLD